MACCNGIRLYMKIHLILERRMRMTWIVPKFEELGALFGCINTCNKSWTILIRLFFGGGARSNLE